MENNLEKLVRMGDVISVAEASADECLKKLMTEAYGAIKWASLAIEFIKPVETLESVLVELEQMQDKDRPLYYWPLHWDGVREGFEYICGYSYDWEVFDNRDACWWKTLREAAFSLRDKLKSRSKQAMPKTKEYAVNYKFEGTGTIIVPGMTKSDAEENAKAELSKITDQLRPSQVHVYRSQIETLSADHGRIHTRWLYETYNPDTRTRTPDNEPFGWTTPPKI